MRGDVFSPRCVLGVKKEERPAIEKEERPAIERDLQLERPATEKDLQLRLQGGEDS